MYLVRIFSAIFFSYLFTGCDPVSETEKNQIASISSDMTEGQEGSSSSGSGSGLAGDHILEGDSNLSPQSGGFNGCETCEGPFVTPLPMPTSPTLPIPSPSLPPMTTTAPVPSYTPMPIPTQTTEVDTRRTARQWCASALSFLFPRAQAEEICEIPEPPPQSQFVLLGKSDYRERFIPLDTAGTITGAEILHRFCEEDPPHCPGGTRGCTLSRGYHNPGKWGYYVETEPDCVSYSETYDYYRLKKTYLYADPPESSHLQLLGENTIDMWESLSGANRAKVRQHIESTSPADIATRRMERLDQWAAHILWHERQHKAHTIGMRSAMEQVANGIAVSAATHFRLPKGQDPVAEINQCLNDRLNTAFTKLRAQEKKCSTELHKADGTEGQPFGGSTYYFDIANCGCNGVRCEFPPYAPPTDILCDYTQIVAEALAKHCP